SLRKLDDGTMREAGEHDVIELVELCNDRGIDPRIRMAEEIHPPRAHRIEVTAAIVIIEPRAGRARDRHRRRAFVLLHLRARMPDGEVAARRPLRVVQAHGTPLTRSRSSASRLHPLYGRDELARRARL